MKTMTELKTLNLEEIEAISRELLKKSNEETSVEVKRDLDADLDEVIGYYAGISKNNFYNEAVASGDPMRYACVEFFYPVIRVKETKEKDTNTIVREIAPAYRPVDLRDLHTKKGGIGADTNWIYDAEKLNFYLTIRAAERVGAKVNSDAFRMSEVSKARELGKNPVSNTNLLRTLQTIITEMIGGDYKATSHDVNYLVDVYANDSKKSKTAITLANHRTLAGYLKKVCRHIITGESYDVDQPEAREKAKK